MTKRLALITTLLATALLAATPASAQQMGSRAPRPNRSLFGGGVSDTSQLLTANLNLGGTLDQDLSVSGQRPRGDVTTTGGLNYSLSQQFGKLSFGVAASSWAHYYPIVSDDVIFNHRASLYATMAFSESSTLTLSQWVTYAPYNMRAFYPQGMTALQSDPTTPPGLAPGYDPAYGLNNDMYLNSGTQVTFRQQVSERGSLDFGYSRNGTAYTLSGGRQTYHSLRAGFSYSLAKGLSARVGYGGNLQRGATTGTTNWRGRSIDAGIDFNRALSISRSTTLGFATGVTGVDDGVSSRYYVTGNARLTHMIGRSWTASVSYYRDVQYVDGITDPLVGDSLIFDIDGVVGRKWQVFSSAGGRRGTFGITTGAPSFDGTYFRSGVRYAITRYLGLSADYAYFNYRTGAGVALPVGIRPRTDRQSLRAMVNLWVPVIADKRRP